MPSRPPPDSPDPHLMKPADPRRRPRFAEMTEAQREIARAKRDRHETSLATQLDRLAPLVPPYVRQHRALAHVTNPATGKPYGYRFDFAWPDQRLAVEVQGLTRGRGAHQDFAGYRRDVDKHNQATLDGWALLAFTEREINDRSAADTIAEWHRRHRARQRAEAAERDMAIALATGQVYTAAEQALLSLLPERAGQAGQEGPDDAL